MNSEATHFRKIRVLFGSLGWPCGVLEIASWASREGLAECRVCPVCSEVDDQTADDARSLLGEPFVEALLRFQPHLVGFRLEGGQFERIRRIVGAVRKLRDVEIVLGGPTATSHPAEALGDCGVDYLFAGEAEEPFNLFLRLATRPNSRDRMAEIPGLAYRHAGRVHVNTLPGDGFGRTASDDERPIEPARARTLRNRARPVAPAGVIQANRLNWSLLRGFAEPFDSLYFTAGRGCPGECAFCAKLHGQTVRVKSAQQLLEEIDQVDALVHQGKIRVSRWPLFEHVADAPPADGRVAWAAVYDEDFFLSRRRAIEFLRLWDRSPLRRRYRLSLQTNPCSMLTSRGQVHAELLAWIDRVKPMVQLGGESFNGELLGRWRKRHNLAQLQTVLDALDTTRQDYTIFQLLTDFDSTPQELVETLRLLIVHAFGHRRMRIAGSPFTIPLFDSEARCRLEYSSTFPAERIGHFTDYERPQPGWMDPLTAELADLADAELQWAIHPTRRDAAIVAAMEAVAQRIDAEARRSDVRDLRDQAQRALEQVKQARFQALQR